jgi:hypothetical protein
MRKVSVVVCTQTGTRKMGHPRRTMARESTMEKVSAPKKKIQGFSHVFTLEKF